MKNKIIAENVHRKIWKNETQSAEIVHTEKKSP
jgi:hypothetical protein